VQIVDGSETFRILARDKFQVTELTTRNPTTALPALSAYSTTSEASSLVATFGFRPSTESSGVETPDTPSDNDEGYINFTLSNDNATPQQWDAARITWIGTDVSDGTEDADLEFETMVNGALATALKIGVSGVSGSVVSTNTSLGTSDTLLSSQLAIKTYVDTEISSAIGSNNEWSEILANGNTSGANDVIIDNGQGLVVGHTAQVATNFTSEFQILGTGNNDSSMSIQRYSPDPTGAFLWLSKSRGALGTPGTAVVDNDVIGEIRFTGDDGGDLATDDGGDLATSAVAIRAEVDDSAIAANEVGGALVLSTAPGASANDLTEALRIDSSQLVGIGAASGGARLEVVDSGLASSTVLKVTSDDDNPYGVIVGNDTFSTSDVEGLALYVTNAGISKIRALGTGGVLQFGTPASSSHVQLDNSGMLSIGDTANANMTVGLTINQGANDDEILALKSSDDVAHGLTGVAETDTYGFFAKNSITAGGIHIRSLAEDSGSVNATKISSYGGTGDTTKTTAARGLVEFQVYENDGAGSVANITANGNVFAVRAQVSGGQLTRFMVDEDGDMYSVTAGQTFDDYDDLVALDYYDKVRSGMISPKDAIKASYGKYAEYNEKALIEMGVLGDTIANGGLTNQSQLSRLLTGGVRKLSENHMSLVEEVKSLRSDLAIATNKLQALTEGK
jgi:hypothetical protein